MHTLKKFIHYYGPYKAVFFLDLICAAVISLVDLAFPQILRTLTKTLFTEPADCILQALLPIGAGLLVIYILQALCKYYVSYQGHMMGAKMERDMRQQLFDHYEKLSFSYYDQNNSGQMMSKLVSDLFDISEFAGSVWNAFSEKSKECQKAVVLMADDDFVKDSTGKEYKQARPNVFIEIGYMIHKCGLKNVTIICSQGCTMPSDIGGLIYVTYKEEKWTEKLRKQLNR